MNTEYASTVMKERALSAAMKMMTTKEMSMSTEEKFEHENKVYIVAGVHPKDGVVKLDTGKRYTLREAQERAKELNATCGPEGKRLGLIGFVAYNTTAEAMRPPYMIDMDQEFNFVLDHADESSYVGMEVTNNNAEGSITWH